MANLGRGTIPDLYLSALANIELVTRDTYRLESEDMTLQKLPYIYGPERCRGSFINITGHSSLGQFSQVAEGANVPQTTPVQSYDKSFTPLKYGLRIDITDETFEDDKFASMEEFARELGRSAPDTIETQLANILNNGFGTETAADGLSIFNTAHTTAAAGTYQNRPTVAGDLAFSTFEQAYIDIGNLIDDAGKTVVVKMKTLLVPTEFYWTAMRLLDSVGMPFSANNDPNPARGIVTAVKSEKLTDTDAWMLFAEQPAHGWIEVKKKEPTKETPQRDTRNGVTSFVMTYRRIGGVHDPRWCYGNPGA